MESQKPAMPNSTGRGQSAMMDDEAYEQAEGSLAKAIEKQTAKLPSDLFLWAAGASIIGSLALQMSGRRNRSIFVGQWAPTFLVLGLYNKLVKVAGSDRTEDTRTIH